MKPFRMKKRFLFLLPMLLSATVQISAAQSVSIDELPALNLQNLDTLELDGKTLVRGTDYLADVQISNDKTQSWIRLAFQGDYQGEVIVEHTIGDIAPFADTIGHYGQDGISYIADLGYMKGKADGLFHPNDSISRGELVTILQRLAGNSEELNSSPFADVNPAQPSYFTHPALWAYKNGVVKGYTATDGTLYFRGERSLSRQEMALMLYRFKGDNASSGTLDNKGFADVANVGEPYREGMLWAVENGIIQGSDMWGSLWLNPQNNCTRAQMALMLERFNKLA